MSCRSPMEKLRTFSEYVRTDVGKSVRARFYGFLKSVGRARCRRWVPAPGPFGRGGGASDRGRSKMSDRSPIEAPTNGSKHVRSDEDKSVRARFYGFLKGVGRARCRRWVPAPGPFGRAPGSSDRGRWDLTLRKSVKMNKTVIINK